MGFVCVGGRDRGIRLGARHSFYNWGYASYANPYYAAETVVQPIVIEQIVAEVSRRR